MENLNYTTYVACLNYFKKQSININAKVPFDADENLVKNVGHYVYKSSILLKTNPRKFETVWRNMHKNYNVDTEASIYTLFRLFIREIAARELALYHDELYYVNTHVHEKFIVKALASGNSLKDTFSYMYTQILKLEQDYNNANETIKKEIRKKIYNEL